MLFEKNKGLLARLGLGFLLVAWVLVGMPAGQAVDAATIPDGLWNRVDEAPDGLVVMVLLKTSNNATYRTAMASKDNRSQARQLVAQAQNRVLDQVSESGVVARKVFTNLPSFSARVTRQGLEALAASDQVLAVVAPRKYKLKTAQGLPLMSAWSTRDSYGGSGVAIAIMDTGINSNQAAFKGSDGSNKVLGGTNTAAWFVGTNQDIGDNDGHGTACAAIAAGSDTNHGDYRGGVAPQAKLYSLKVFDDMGYTGDEEMADAMDWAISNQYANSGNPIMVMSASLGGEDPYTSACDDKAVMMFMNSNLSALESAGIAFFAAAGNEGFCNALDDPACHSKAISVGAVNDADIGSDADCYSSYSCLGARDTTHCPYQDAPQYYWYARPAGEVPAYSNSASFLDLLAPSGCATVPTIYGYETCFDGTSAATPYAAGAAAVLQSRAKELRGAFLTVAQLKRLMVSTGDGIYDAKSGVTTPRLNLERALNKLASGNLD